MLFCRKKEHKSSRWTEEINSFCVLLVWADDSTVPQQRGWWTMPPYFQAMLLRGGGDDSSFPSPHAPRIIPQRGVGSFTSSKVPIPAARALLFWFIFAPPHLSTSLFTVHSSTASQTNLIQFRRMHTRQNSWNSYLKVGRLGKKWKLCQSYSRRYFFDKW